MNEPETMIASDDDGPTRVCTEGMRHALLARERAALAPTRIDLHASEPPTPTFTVLASAQRSRHKWLAAAATCLALAVGSFGIELALHLRATRRPSNTSARGAEPANVSARAATAAAATRPASVVASSSDTAAPARTPAGSAASPSPSSSPANARAAADALVAADYAGAVAAYGSLARMHPDEPVFALLERVLSKRLAERCRSGRDPARGCP